MSLAPYRRHRRDCKAGHTEELRTSEYDERKKGWKQGSPKYANVARPGGLGFASAQGVRSVRLSSGSCLAFVRGGLDAALEVCGRQVPRHSEQGDLEIEPLPFRTVRRIDR